MNHIFKVNTSHKTNSWDRSCIWTVSWDRDHIWNVSWNRNYIWSESWSTSLVKHRYKRYLGSTRSWNLSI